MGEIIQNYYPYFRGKQFELLAIRETAALLAEAKFTPIIEPVRDSTVALNALKKTLDVIEDKEGQVIIIINPAHGDYKDDHDELIDSLKDDYLSKAGIQAGILLNNSTTFDEVKKFVSIKQKNSPVFIHNTEFSEYKELINFFSQSMSNQCNIFLTEGALYRKNFEESACILIKDGFVRRRNADYPEVEIFSELHITYTYKYMGLKGFGDFLIVGDAFSETGGPAYAVAIHITFIDQEQDNKMYIYHFVSDRRDTASDPAGKFKEALARLVEKLDSGNSKILETEAIKEFRNLHSKGHFPGLGYIKKLSMKHHIEVLANHLG